MTQFSFALDCDEDLIIVQSWVEGYEVRLALDTAATHTVIDFNVLLMLGYSFDSPLYITNIETANGVIEANIVELTELNTSGISKQHFPVLTYDFLRHGIVSAYDGVLGLDFLRNTVLTINFQQQFIVLQS
ncbi:MAG: retroviral-like aspartic protease family protein [Saprospiraceae bacterium]|nr:retroviral-like aspartic protease family protein [Saprospiraceae bacterium]